MGLKLVDYLLYEPEDNGILWIKFNRPERMNALVGTAEENGTVQRLASTCAPVTTTPTSA
jgi:enoyl-CoA hydratase/carnithine racemase